MKPDPVLQEACQVKDQLGEKFSWNPIAICAHLMEAQLLPREGTPLVQDLQASLKQQTARIARLPERPLVDEFLPEDPIFAELRSVRAQLAQEREASALREKPPRYGHDEQS